MWTTTERARRAILCCSLAYICVCVHKHVHKIHCIQTEEHPLAVPICWLAVCLSGPVALVVLNNNILFICCMRNMKCDTVMHTTIMHIT